MKTIALFLALVVSAFGQTAGQYRIDKKNAGTGYSDQIITPGASAFFAWNISGAPIPLAFTDVATVGTITTGTWQGTAIGDAYIASAGTWNAKESALTFAAGLNRSSNTITIDSTVATLAGSQTLTNKTLTAPVLTTPNIGAATGASLSFSGGGTISGSSGAVSVAASGSNQNITLLPSGTGRVIAQSATGDAFVVMDAASGFFGGFRLQTAGTDRWTVAKQATSQDLIVSRFNSSGVFINNPFSIVSGTGQVLLPSGIASTSSSTGTLVVTGGLGVSGAINAGGAISGTNLTLAPSASATPASNGQLTIEASNNTTLTFRFRGSDGTTRSGTILLSP